MVVLNSLSKEARAPEQLIENQETRPYRTPAQRGESVMAGTGEEEGGRQAREGAVSEARFIINRRRPGVGGGCANPGVTRSLVLPSA